MQFFFPDRSQIDADYAEAARYLGYKKIAPPEQDVSDLISSCCDEMHSILMPKSVFDFFPLTVKGIPNSAFSNSLSSDSSNSDSTSSDFTHSDLGACEKAETSSLSAGKSLISFADLSFESLDLARNLQGCSQIAIFAATLGPQVDSLIHRYERFDTLKAAILQSVGAMFTEVFVDLVNDEIKKIAAASGKKCKPRYSPGFGDVPLKIQKEFFRLLPCTKIGLTLMDTLIMSPEKSVTAFVGIL